MAWSTTIFWIWIITLFSVCCDQLTPKSVIPDNNSSNNSSGTQWDNRNRVFDFLTEASRYDRRSRPGAATGNVNGPVRITTSLYIGAFGGLDSQSTEFSSLVDLRFQWIDPRLYYAEMSPETDILIAEEWGRNQIWVPTIYVPNEKQSRRILMPKENVLISVLPSGLVSYQYRLGMKIYCTLDVRRFPFDKQTCYLHLESWSLGVSDLILEWADGSQSGSGLMAVQINPEFHPMEFSLKRVATSSIPLTRQSFSGRNVSRLYVTFTIQRESGHYIIDYYIPGILLVFLSWISFWLEPSQIPGRVTLGSSAMLTFITLSRNLSSCIPKVAYINSLDIYSMICLAFIFCSLLELAVVNSLWRRRRNIEVKELNTRVVLRSALTPITARRMALLKEEIIRPDDFHRNAQLDQANGESLETCSMVTLQVPASTPESSLLDVKNKTKNRKRISGHRLQSHANETRDQIPCRNRSLWTGDPMRMTNEDQTDENIGASPQEMAKWLDRRSRIFFPITFLTINALYWAFIWL